MGRNPGSTFATIDIGGYSIECTKELGPTGLWSCTAPDGTILQARTLYGLERKLKAGVKSGKVKGKSGGGGGGGAKGNQPQITGGPVDQRQAARSRARHLAKQATDKLTMLDRERAERDNPKPPTRYDRAQGATAKPDAPANRYEQATSTATVGRYQPPEAGDRMWMALPEPGDGTDTGGDE